MAEQGAPSIYLPDQVPECSNVHWMPFGIAYDGPTSTSAQHFEPRLQQPAGQGPDRCSRTRCFTLSNSF